MFKSPYSRIAEEKPEPKKASMKPMSKAEPEEHDDDVAKSVTVHQHHDGHYSTEGDEGHDHANIEALKDHLGKFFDEEEQEGSDESDEAPKSSAKPSSHQMF